MSYQEVAPDSEISCLDVLNFLRASWKKLTISAVLGAILGLSNWYFLENYTSEIVLNNRTNINLVSWRALQKTLPNLAFQIINEGKVPEGQESLYHTLSNPDWWLRNTLSNFSLIKSDTKDLVSTSELAEIGTSISSFSIKAAGLTKKKAIDNALGAKTFFLQGASYLEIRSLINEQEIQLINAGAEIEKKINLTLIDLGYQQERLRSLKVLSKHFPNESKVISSAVDVRESSTKLMPISVQMIAANVDIIISKESLERLKDAQAEIVSLRVWVMNASPIISSSYDGIAITKKLLEQEAQLRINLGASDPKALVYMDNLRTKLLQIDARYSKGFEMNTAPTALKKGMIKSTVAGLLISFFLMLSVLLYRRVLKHWYSQC
jgi:hypothetical protein